MVALRFLLLVGELDTALKDRALQTMTPRDHPHTRCADSYQVMLTMVAVKCSLVD